jgi:hypothetical protein
LILSALHAVQPLQLAVSANEANCDEESSM